MRWASTILFALAALAAPARGWAQQEPTARARVDSSHYVVGDWITIHVDLSHPKEARVQCVAADTMNGFSVLERRAAATLNDTSSTIEVVVARYDSAAAVLPPLPFEVRAPGDSSGRTILTNPLLLTVRSVPVDTTKDIHDLKPPLSVPITLAEIALYAGIVLVLGGLGYMVYRIWKKRKGIVKGEKYVPPQKPAHIIALEELAALKEKKLWQKGEIKRYYSEVTEILRRYIENRYQQKALEETTDEILAGLASIKLPGDLLRSIEKILRRADLVKFAKSQPGIPEHEEMLTTTYDVVERTKIVVMTPVAAAGSMTGGRSGS